MAYLGNRPAESFASFEKQVFTIVNSQTAYTLSHSVTNENDIRLVVNSVVQEPGSGKAYTASGTTLTLSAALTNGTDEMYCVFLGRALQTVNPPNASVGNSQTAPTIITGQTAETSIATDDTILIHDTSASALRKMTKANFVSGLGSVAGDVAFRVVPSSAQSISSTATTVIAFGTETFDIGGGFASNKFTVPSGKAGKYFFQASILNSGQANNDLWLVRVQLRKNGSTVFKPEWRFAQGSSNGEEVHSFNAQVHGCLDLAVGDYVQIYSETYGKGSGYNISDGQSSVWFTGFKVSS